MHGTTVRKKKARFKFAVLQNFIQTSCLPFRHYFVMPDTLLELHGIVYQCRPGWLRGEIEIYLDSLLTSTLDGCEWSVVHWNRLTPRESVTGAR